MGFNIFVQRFKTSANYNTNFITLNIKVFIYPSVSFSVSLSSISLNDFVSRFHTKEFRSQILFQNPRNSSRFPYFDQKVFNCPSGVVGGEGVVVEGR